MNNVLYIILLLAVSTVVLFVVVRWRVRRAAFQVIRIFKDQNAIDAKNARTIDELGLKPRGLMEGMFRGTDYKPHALNGLMQAEIVHMTEDGSLYLSEEKLINSRFYKP